MYFINNNSNKLDNSRHIIYTLTSENKKVKKCEHNSYNVCINYIVE